MKARPTVIRGRAAQLSARTAITLAAISVFYAAGLGASADARTLHASGASTAPMASSLSGGGLTSISCTTGLKCVAVGNLYSRTQQYAMTWNGNKWVLKKISVPSWSQPFGSSAHLWSVSCTMAKRCTAVGDFPGASKAALIEHWNGKKRSRMAEARPSKPSNLASVDCISSRFCLAWGNASTTACQCEPPNLTERWNGSKWAVVSSPSSTYLAGSLACQAVTNCLAVGDNFVNTKAGASKWNGSKWTAVKPMYPDSNANLLWSVSCGVRGLDRATSCMAVGSRGTSGNSTPLAELWNGIKWTVIPAAPATGSGDEKFNDVSCPDAGDCIAVGTNGTTHPLVEQWNMGAAAWSVIPAAPNPGKSISTSLTAVSCVTAKSCMAIGYYQTATATHTLAERWNGSSWSVVSTPS